MTNIRLALVISLALVTVIYSSTADAQRRKSLADRVSALEAQLANSSGEDEARKTLTDLVFQLSELEEEVRQLRGQIEQQKFELENLRRGELDRFNDLDRRLTELAARGPAAVISPPPSGVVPGTVDATDPLPAPGNPAGGSVSSPTVAAPTNSTGDGSGTAAEDYDAAFQTMKDGRFEQSARQFAAFLARHPGSDLVDNAQYWLGESYYAQREYKISSETFRNLVQRYPDSSKVPDARLKLGFSVLELKDYEAARQTLEQVAQDYPGTQVAGLANRRLEIMRLRGFIQ